MLNKITDIKKQSINDDIQKRVGIAMYDKTNSAVSQKRRSKLRNNEKTKRNPRDPSNLKKILDHSPNNDTKPDNIKDVLE